LQELARAWRTKTSKIGCYLRCLQDPLGVAWCCLWLPVSPPPTPAKRLRFSAVPPKHGNPAAFQDESCSCTSLMPVFRCGFHGLAGPVSARGSGGSVSRYQGISCDSARKTGSFRGFCRALPPRKGVISGVYADPARASCYSSITGGSAPVIGSFSTCCGAVYLP